MPTLTTIENQRGYLAGDLMQFVEQAPTRRGSIGIRHASFQDFLTNGLADDVWVFGMVLLDFHGQRRPVDLLTCLDLPQALLADAHCQHMTLTEYVVVVDGYLSSFQDQQTTELLAMRRAGQARSLTPRARSKSGASRS